MKAISSLFLAILVLVVLTGYATSLKAWGRNVLTRYVTTFKQEGYTRLVTTTNGRKCTKTCTWSCCNCRRCRTQYKTVPRTYYRRVAKQKPIYYCAAGWRASGDECTIPICTGGCRNGGRCVSPERCQCNSGWQGPKCRTDKNECATNNGGCQHHCNNRPGSYNCFCDPGYNPVGSQCQDINECGGPNNCQQKCVNKPGTYSCACNVGYRLLNDSVSCSDIDECANSVCQYKCKNTAGSFFCSCPRGYLLTTNKRDCADHDECMTGHHACQQRCVNHPGGYSCACQMGFTLNKDNQSCSDIDECKLGVSGCADQCNNTIGSFHCLCRSGYVLNPDNKTCSDQDECKNGRHTCSQICGNTPGSYYCSCRPGYYLDSDLRTCKGYSCISISKPAKGYMNCTGQTMDSVCQFSCQPGYELVGSRLRTCLANGKWSGNRAFCEVKTCKKPPPPANGHVKIPCSTTYKGKCSFGCRAGFFLNGSRTVSCSADSEWVPIAGKCDAITVCHPNPCFHGGQCNPINSTAFWCNCTNTAYTGNKCHKGIFRKPKYPRLQQGNSFNITFEMSPPENQLTITPSASGLEFLPRNLVIYPVQMEEGKLYPANMTVTAHLPGMHLITYTLSGVASNLYETVLPDTVIVVDNETSCNGNLSSSLPEGCHQARLLKCPHDSFLYAISTEPWKQTQGQVSSKGVVTVLSANNRTLPLGVIGTTLDKSNLIHLSVSADNKFCKNHPSVDVQCLPSEIIASVFIQSLTASLPRWLRLIPSKTLSGFDTNDAITYVWSGLQLKDVLKGLGLSVNERSYYSALLYSSALTVELNKSSVSLPKYDGKGTHLVVTDLCSNSWPPNALIVFNPLSYKTLQAISLYEKLAVRGWKVTAMAVQFSKFSSLNYSVYTRKQEQELISGSLELFGRAEKTINGSHPISFLNVRLVGNAIFGVSDIDKVWEDSPTSWKAGIRGEVTANMTLFLLEQKVSVELRLDESSGLVQYRESLNHKSYKVTDTYELSLNGFSAKDPFELNVLGSFIESPSGKVSFHANSQLLPNSSAKELSGSSAIQLEFALSGVVKFGPLKFPNMSISITMVSEEFKTCSVQGNKVDVPGLIISPTFNQPEMLGRFFTCLNSDSLQIFLPSYSRNSSKGVLDTSVALLGDSFKAKLNISNSSLNFKKEVNLFDNYRLSIHGSSQLQAWDSLALKVTGTFGKTDPNSHQNALEDTMKEIINDYTKVVVETTTQRLKVFESMSDKIKARIRNSHLRLVQAENKTHLAIEQYLRALKVERTAFKDVKKAEKILTNSSEELNQLKASLERLCSVIECPFICVSGTACNTCYEDLISKEQGVCPATCHNLRQERLPPRQETSTCHEEECDHSGGNFVSTISCTFEKVGKRVVKPLIIMGGTAALSSTGVPPMFAYWASSAVVNAAYEYDKSKDPHKSIYEGVKSGHLAVITTKAGEKAGESLDGGGNSGLWLAGVQGAIDAGQQCNDEGSWDCELKPYPCSKEVFNYRYTIIPYQCETSCEVNVVKETIATPCCREVNCASRVRDSKCKEKNAFCRIAREKATSKLNTAKKEILKPLNELREAKKVFNVAQIELAKRKLDLEAATNERDILQRAHNAILKAAKISESSNEQNRAFLQDAIALTQLWNSTNGTCPVDIKEISFDVTLFSPSETQIPVLFRIATRTKEKTIFPIVDFSALNESLQQTAKQIVKELFGDVNAVLRSGHPLNQVETSKNKGRRKRAIDERGSDVTTLVEFKKKCALVTNYNRALSDIIGTLYDISTKSLGLLNNVTNHTLEQQHAGAHDYSLNLTQAAELGLSEKDIDDSINAVPSDEEVMKAASLFELRNATNHKKVQTAIDVVFRDWEASMETVFNCTSLECSGFIDCMEDFVDNLLFLYQGIELPAAIRLRRLITIIGREVKTLLSYEDLSVSEAAEKSTRILQMLKDIKDTNVFCAVAPNITHNPVPIKNLKIGQTLELSCKATADPAPSYRWRKNGVLLSGKDTDTLRIEGVTENETGNYTCEAYNHLKVEQSMPSHIFVHAAPVLVRQPPSNMNIPIGIGFFMRCKANSLAKPLRYQWLYKSVSGNSYNLVPNGTFSVLNFHSVKKSREGYYKCNVSNPFDYTLSQSVRLRVVGFSLAVPSLGLSFKIGGDSRSLFKVYKESKSVDSDKTSLDVNDDFQEDVKVSFTTVVNSLVNLSSDAVQDLSLKDCQMIEKSTNISCSVSFRVRGFNTTGLNPMNRTASENAVGVMDSVQQLERAVSILVNESVESGISLNTRSVSLKLDPVSWSVGKYISLCPIGTTLFENNFVCVNCPPGTSGAANGTSPACFPCPMGTYQPGEGKTSCLPCPMGFNSRRTGLEDLTSCKDITPETTTSKAKTSQLSDTSTKLPEPVSLTTSKEEVTTNEPGATNLQSQHDVAFKWKLAFGVCLAVIILLLAGLLLYCINYRVKRVRRFKISEDHSSKTARNERERQTFHNPIYDDSEVLANHDNSTYKMNENPEKKKKKNAHGGRTFQNPMNSATKFDEEEPTVCGHDNPAYRMTSDLTDKEA